LQNIPITAQEFREKINPILLLAQIVRHVNSKSEQHVQELGPYAQLKDLELEIPQELIPFYEMFGEFTTNAGTGCMSYIRTQLKGYAMRTI
jgi:hypothetical protein